MDLTNFETPGTKLFCISFVYCCDGKINKGQKKNWAKEQRRTTKLLVGKVDNALSDETSRETGINISQMNLEKLRSNFETDVCLTVEEIQ